MVMFRSEEHLLATIAQHDELVARCVRGDFDFGAFCEQYGSFYSSYALDGHESDEEERALLEKHEDRIAPHRLIAFEILGKLCSDEDAEKENYIGAGRFGSAEALSRLRRVKFSSPTA